MNRKTYTLLVRPDHVEVRDEDGHHVTGSGGLRSMEVRVLVAGVPFE